MVYLGAFLVAYNFWEGSFTKVLDLEEQCMKPYEILSYRTVVLYIEIMKVRKVWP